jgi:hypothetical protein
MATGQDPPPLALNGALPAAPRRRRPLRRVSVTGVMGSGTSTFGLRLASGLGVMYLELDARFHQPHWTELPRDEFRARVSEVIADEGWVVDGNYGAVRDLVCAGRCCVTARTLRRGLTHAELWNGNRDALRNVLRTDPERNIILGPGGHTRRCAGGSPTRARTRRGPISSSCGWPPTTTSRRSSTMSTGTRDQPAASGVCWYSASFHASPSRT